MARCIEPVILSAYMMTWPSTWRAARPIVWISAALRAQVAFLVGVEDRNQRDLWQVQALAQQVDADHHVVDAEAQVAQDVDPLERVDLGVQVVDLDAHLAQVVGQVLGHPLGQRGHQRPLAACDPLA